VSLQLLGHVAVFTLTVRVFGSDVVRLLRRAAAAGVRVGVSELSRAEREESRR
jgi:hypothetical protein